MKLSFHCTHLDVRKSMVIQYLAVSFEKFGVPL